MEDFCVKLTYTGAIAAFMSKRDWNQQIVEPSWMPALRLWRDSFRPVHFTSEADRLYGYERRSGQDATRGTKAFYRSYFGQKLVKLHHARPLEYSGRTKAETARGMFRLTAKSGKYSMPLSVPTLRPRESRIDMRAELTAIPPGEGLAMVYSQEQEMMRRLRAAKTVIRSTVMSRRIGGI